MQAGAIRMNENEGYFAEEKADMPYADAMENLADYFALAAWLCDAASDWREQSDGQHLVPPRGVRITGGPKTCAAVLGETNYSERSRQPVDPVVRMGVREGMAYIASREEATVEAAAASDASAIPYGILRMKGIIDTFGLTKRQTVVLILLCAARHDIHILEAFSYIAADEGILEAGAPTVGLLDMVLHLAFDWEEVQAEAIAGENGMMMRFLICAAGDAPGSGQKGTLQKNVCVRDMVYRYLCFGEEVLQVETGRGMESGQFPVYFEDFACMLWGHEEDCFAQGRQSDFCYIQAADTDDAVYVLSHVFSELERPLCTISQEKLDAADREFFFARRMAGFLYHEAILVRVEEADEKGAGAAGRSGEKLSAAIHLLRRELPYANTIYLVGTRQIPNLRVHGKDMPAVLELPLPDVNMRREMWQDLFDAYSLVCGEGVDLADIADFHELSFGKIRTVVEKCAATSRMASGGGTVEREQLQEFIFSLSTANFEHLATRVEARYTWDDIFLQEPQKKRLKYACDRFRLRNRVGAEWGISKKNAYGNAIIILMYGPPGTGKTMAAQVVSNEVMTPLYRVDVSQIYSKYIGETQKNISRIFEEAQKRNVVLFFDEADALFTRRSEVRDSHDKYANADTSFLLQKVEEYRGISILATNNSQSFDPAFMRRLTYVIRFERPDVDTRKQMWRSMMPDQVPLAPDVDLDWFVERFPDLSGSNIKSIIMMACYMAAADGTDLSMRHLVRSVRLEFEKLGRLVEQGSFERYAGYLVDGVG